MDDEDKKDEEEEVGRNVGTYPDRRISDEALQEREQRSIVYTDRIVVSQGTDTKDDPFPPRTRKKKKIPPAVPARKHLGDNESQTDAGSADSAASAPRSRPSFRSASAEPPSSSRSSRRTLETRSLDRDGFSSQEGGKTKESKKGLGRHMDYDTEEVLNQGDDEEDGDRESLSGGTSFHWRMSQSSLDVESLDGCASGLTGFIVTALAMGLLIMISWFIISQLDFILMVVTWSAKAFEESLLIFNEDKERPRVEKPRMENQEFA
ncbi:uncharacterized protein LOC128253682 [Drosophila gunungcola]|uniref:uncharacterized protein LOC128253682 n=1 Tax=Drosophila gunungcola TaxID=103775 RepID=UPI0022E61929|nr:uncharacterized protein LOC128253682 [Drosophila gunungcola]